MKTVRHTAIVPTGLAAARQAAADVCRRHSGLRLAPGTPRRGTLADRSQRFAVCSTADGKATYGYLELTPLDAHHTQVELALFALAPADGRRRLPGAGRRTIRRVERDINAFAHAFAPAGSRPSPRPDRPSPRAAGGRRR